MESEKAKLKRFDYLLLRHEDNQISRNTSIRTPHGRENCLKCSILFCCQWPLITSSKIIQLIHGYYFLFNGNSSKTVYWSPHRLRFKLGMPHIFPHKWLPFKQQSGCFRLAIYFMSRYTGYLRYNEHLPAKCYLTTGQQIATSRHKPTT